MVNPTEMEIDSLSHDKANYIVVLTSEVTLCCCKHHNFFFCYQCYAAYVIAVSITCICIGWMQTTGVQGPLGSKGMTMPAVICR